MVNLVLRDIEIADSVRVDPCVWGSIAAIRPNGPWQVSLGQRPQVSRAMKAFYPEMATQTSVAEPCQGSCPHGTSTWGGVHPHSQIHLPQADMPCAIGANRSFSGLNVKQLTSIYCQTSRSALKR